MMLRLLIESASPENPSIPVRACIDPSDRARLEELRAVDVHVLLVVIYANGVHDRHLFPLTQALAFVGFRYTGTHIIKARLVIPQNLKEMKKALLTKENRNSYKNNLLEGTEFQTYRSHRVDYEKSELFQESEELDIVIDRKYFAPEPPEWFKNWVEMPYNFPSVDQCHFRKRALQAVTLQLFWAPLLYLFWAIVGLAIWVVGVLLLARGLTLKPLLHPRTKDWDDIWPKLDLGESYYPQRSGRSFTNDKGEIKPLRLLYSPLVFVLATSLLGLLYWKFNINPMQLFYGTLASFLVVGFGLLGLKLVDRLIDRWSEHFMSVEYTENVNERKRRELEDAFSYLSCPTADKAKLAVTLTAIPARRRSFKLYFQATKRKVCRAFPG